MDLGQIQIDITAWVEQLSGLPVEWGRMPMKVWQGPFVLAYAGAIAQLGHDEPEYRYNDLTGDLEEHMIGVRRMTLRLSFRSFDQRLGQSARQYAENFRILTQSTTSTDAIRGYRLGLWGTGELVESDYEWNGRMVNQVDMDVDIGIRAELMNPSYSGGYIRNVNIEGQSPVVTEMCEPVVDEAGDPVVAEESITIQVITEDPYP